MRHGKKILIGIALLAIFVILTILAGNQKAFAATTNQTNVTVQVATVTQISVVPTVISWSNVNPGSVGGLLYLDIRNSGSVNISTIYAYPDTLTSEPNNPYPAGSPTAFSSGSVLMLRKNETNAAYYYAGRLEWNITRVEPGVPGPPGSSTSGGDIAVVWGYYRNATPGGNYLFYLVNGSVINATGGCNSTNSKIMIEQDADNGTVATRQPDLGGTITATTPDWGIYNYSSNPLAGHCVALHRTCEKILIYRYDRRTSPNFEACQLTNAEQSFYDADLHTTLTPGEEFTINLDAWVPEGVPAGWLKSSWLTIEAGT